MNIAVVIPCYKVKDKILGVLERVGHGVRHVIVVDDKCPDGSGDYVVEHCQDDRVLVVKNQKNMGVGGAVKEGYLKALSLGSDIVVKIDGDGQMDPALIDRFVSPIVNGEADYTKGNRFYYLDDVKAMPIVRKIGNSCLSIITKFSSGYYHVFDPTNGYTAISREAIERMDLSSIENRYFFESDMLFNLYLIEGVVKDVPMSSFYADEESNLNVMHSLFHFSWFNLRNFMKRIILRYLIRDFGPSGVFFLSGCFLTVFGAFFGSITWVNSVIGNEYASSGTVMLAALPFILGFQCFMSFMQFDVAGVPRTPISKVKQSLPNPILGENEP